MRTDLEGQFRLRSGFTDAEEARRWSQEREISNITHSFSGGERNRLFINHHAEEFFDLSGLSGIDSPADGRVFVLWDYNRDGWQDLAVVNSNNPAFHLFRNRIGDIEAERSTADAARSQSAASPNRCVAMRFVGGNRTPTADSGWSPRNAIGATIRLRLDPDHTLLREHTVHRGMGGQNSATQLIGIGLHDTVRQIEIQWPSGRTTSITDVAAGTLVTVFENPTDSPDGSGVQTEVYRSDSTHTGGLATLSPDNDPVQLTITVDATAGSASGPAARLNVYTSTATWCAACLKNHPAVEQLRAAFSNDVVGMFGIPVDPEDDPAKLEQYVNRHQPPYVVLANMPLDERQHFSDVVADLTHADALPSTIVTDAAGVVQLATPGIPTVSDLRRLLRSTQSTSKNDD